ncbi:NifU family protein [Phenylobacterium sp.]|uniref:NifU family protein n=1 Tax=Phenylobacterium sp. TaxID=1871053 RepID=UPI002FE18925
MIILTETTPNPNALKFRAPTPLTRGESREFSREGFDPAQSPLAARLFEIAGVERVFVAPDFVTLSRGPAARSWSGLKPEALAAIAEHLDSGEPAVASAVTDSPDAWDQVEAEIRQVLDAYIAPGVARDGGEIRFEAFDPVDGVLWISMHGACGGCPSSQMTLKSAVEQTVRRYVPEVLRVEETAPAEPREDAGGRLRRWMQRLGEGAGRGAARPRTVFTRSGRREAAE